jgi:hypothetical protein
MPASAVRRIARELVVAVFALLAVDLCLTVLAPDSGTSQVRRQRVAESLGLPFDGRSRTEVVADLRGHGVDAYPGMTREWPRIEVVRQQLPDGLYPLSQSSNSTVVECNEGGEYLVYKTDEIGFNNPAALATGDAVDVAAVGEAYTVGHCVPRASSFVGILRRSFPRTVSYGMAGSGALSMLGSQREFVAPRKPKVVLWVVTPWVADTSEEMQDPILAQYLEPAFSQHLLERQPEVDRLWREISIPVQYEFDKRSLESMKRAESKRFSGIATLSHLRARLPIAAVLRRADPPPDTKPFYDILKLARSEVEAWGGQFVVVVVPIYAEIIANDVPETLRSDRIADSVRALGMTVVDGGVIFRKRADPASLYAMRSLNHPNAEGDELLGEAVVGAIAARLASPEAAP